MILAVAVDLLARLLTARPDLDPQNLTEVNNHGAPHTWPHADQYARTDTPHSLIGWTTNGAAFIRGDQ